MTEQQPNQAQSIRGIVPHTCPKCKAALLVSFAIHPPTIGALYTPEETDEAKKLVLERLGAIKFKSEDEKKAAFNWLNDPQTIFGMEDVEALVKNITMNQLDQKNEPTKKEEPKV